MAEATFVVDPALVHEEVKIDPEALDTFLSPEAALPLGTDVSPQINQLDQKEGMGIGGYIALTIFISLCMYVMRKCH